MRDALLALITMSISLLGLFQPVIGLLGYTWFALMRPDVLAYSSGAIPHSLILAIATIVGSFRMLGGAARLLTNWFSGLVLLLQVPIVLSILVNNVRIAPAVSVYNRTIIMSLFIVLLIRTEAELRYLFLVIACSIGVIGAKYGLLGLAHGGIRITQGYGDGMMSGNNELGLAFLMIVPFCWYCRELFEGKWVRLGLALMALGSIAGTIFTYSRGDSIGLAVVALIITARSKRKAVMLSLLAVFAGGAIYLLGDSYMNRMETLKDPEQEASAKQRLDQNKVAIAMWQDYPIFGTGFGGEKYQDLNSQYGGNDQIHIVHNTYLQLLVESGTFALAIFVLLLFGTIVWLQGSIRRARAGLGPAAYPLALQTSLIGFAVVIIFHPRARYDFYYILIMVTAAWYYIQRAMPLICASRETDQVDQEVALCG